MIWPVLTRIIVLVLMATKGLEQLMNISRQLLPKPKRHFLDIYFVANSSAAIALKSIYLSLSAGMFAQEKGNSDN